MQITSFLQKIDFINYKASLSCFEDLCFRSLKNLANGLHLGITWGANIINPSFFEIFAAKLLAF